MSKIVPFEDLADADLLVDAIYESNHDGQLTGEPIVKLLPGTGNMGGFRLCGKGEKRNWVVLFTTGRNKDWPDIFDPNLGKFTYYGDNKTPGHELHETKGNKVLKHAFTHIHTDDADRSKVPPFFIFERRATANGTRSVQFKGLAVPGYPGLSATEDLVAIWKSSQGQRFQNYKAVFTILDTSNIKREWLRAIAKGERNSVTAPEAWTRWVKTGKYTPLLAEPTTMIRSPQQQYPDTELKSQILLLVWQYFKDQPIAFEGFAAQIYQMVDQRVVIDEITRGSMDGGRDAFGRYLLGLKEDPVYAEFSLEAKCYRPSINGESANTVGVKEVARLISRIKHRQFGVLVTTSLIARQAYEEIRSDKHPVIFICGRDIAEILIQNGLNSTERVAEFLTKEFPLS